MKDWNINEIEALTLEEVDAMKEGCVEINGHTVYLVDFGGYFGYSALVFKDGAHIYYANDYELHHKGKSKDELKAWYVETLPNKIFKDEDLEVVENYDDYERKDYFLRNYYIQRIPYETAFHIYHNETEEKEFKRKIKGMFYNPISFCYVEQKYKEFCKTQAELLGKLESAKEAASNGSFEYWKDAFLSEMFNHEYGIAWDADYNVISCFASIGYNNITLEQCFDDAKFTEVQRKAYRAARDKYYETATF